MTLPKGFEHYDMRRAAFVHHCEICQKEILSRRRTGVKFCGATCRKRASNGHKNFKTDFICKNCGGMGFTTQPFQHPEFCSNACRQAAYRKRKSSNVTSSSHFYTGEEKE